MSAPSAAVSDWLTRLVAIDTTSSRSNLELIELVADHARGLGLTPQIFASPGGDKANLLVTVPAADGSTDGGIMLSGHSDVVPTEGQAWTADPYTVTARDGLLYGRGVTDMKGYDAVIVAALAELVAQPLSEPVHVALSYDEEVGCTGAPELVKSLREVGVSPRVCFVGEPTSMRLIRAHKSINLMRATFTGVAAHSSLPTLGVNAIEYAASLVRSWRDQCDRWKADGPYDELYPVAWTTGGVTVVQGGNGVNIVPAQCQVTFEFRAIAAVDDRAVIEAARAYCAELDEAMKAEASEHVLDDEVGVVFEVLAETVGLDTPEDGAAVELGRTLGLELQPDKVTYGTEAGIYAGAGISTVVCGPGDIAQAHKADEFIDPAQLAACEAFIGRLIAHLRG